MRYAQTKARRATAMPLLYLLLFIFTVVAAVGLSGCGRPVAAVDTLLSLQKDGSGVREMTVVPSGLSEEEEQALDKALLGGDELSPGLHCVKEEGPRYRFTLTFSSPKDYAQKVETLLDRQAVALVSWPDTVLASGVYVTEDFTSADLLSGLLDGYSFDLSTASTALSAAGVTHTVPAAIVYNGLTGYQVDEIRIETENLGDGLFTRTVRFRIPRSTSQALGNDLISYFNARTPQGAQAQWEEFPSGLQYTVTLAEVSAQQLQEGMGLLFNAAASWTVSYGSQDDSATPFEDSRQFLERMDLSSYAAGRGSVWAGGLLRDDLSGANGSLTASAVNGQDSGPAVVYEYRLAGQTDENQSDVSGGLELRTAQLQRGGWQNISIQSQTANLEEASAGLIVRFTDTRQHGALQHAAILLSCQGGGIFQREVLFTWEAGEAEAADYAAAYFTAQEPQSAMQNGGNVQILRESGDNGENCRIVLQGDTADLTAALTALFGEGNRLEYRNEAQTFDPRRQTWLKDEIAMEHLFTGQNAGLPLEYTIDTNGKEHLDDVRYSTETRSGSQNLSRRQDNTVSFTLNERDAVVEYNGSTPNAWGAAAYLSGALLIIALAVCLIVFLYRRSKKGPPPKQDGSTEDESDADILARL